MNIFDTIGKPLRRFTVNSVNRQILSATIVVSLCSILVKVVAFLKESIVAWQFGASSAVDAFLIAALIPDFMMNIIASPLNAALIPTYMQVREQKGSQVSEQLLAGTLFWSLVLLGIATLLMAIAAPVYLPWMTLGFSREKLTLTFQLLYVIIPLILLSGIVVFCGAVLNAEERFTLVALSPVTAPAATIFLLLAFGQSIGVFALAIGLLVGAVLEVILLGAALHRRGISLRPRIVRFNAPLQKVAQQYPPSMMAALLMCSSGIVDQSMAAMLAPGSVAALNYASRVNSIPLVLISTGLGAAAFTYFSKMIASHDWQGVNRSLRSCLKLIFWVTVPCMLVLILGAEPIVRLLFQRGEFTAIETHLVAQILAAFALQIPFYVACILITRLLISLNLQHILMWGSAFNLLMNISLNYLFMQWFGIWGIALSTSCVYLFSFLYVLFFAHQNLKKITSAGAQ
ncbi:murein biosynthesis integral membrane protein MurJ [Leptolyngbya ohadii]|uniref:murein biosynthesis integral membrane protein MurJ n=1 Tax=Leptolyngbya ohadii TaxID=1962290 RepID=UPI000B59A41F|nr:lipid II flippase MurJ [Leptolyngbya ohadii]